MIKVGVIGCGHWGPNHIRTFNSFDNSKVPICSDKDEKRLAAVGKMFPSIAAVKDYRDVLSSDAAAVVVSTPTNTHYKLVKEALEAGKHVLCEKPLTVEPEESRELSRLAEKKKLVLMVGHIFLYNDGIRALKKYCAEEAGKIYYAYAQRTNLGPVRKDVNAVYDLATHDISIFNFLMGGKPVSVSATGGNYLQKGIEDVAFITMTYRDDVITNIQVSWLDPLKLRRITVVGEKKMIIWDDLGAQGPIEIYNKGIRREPDYYSSFGEFNLLVRQGELFIPHIAQREPMRTQNAHFLECVEGGKKPLTDARNGLEVVEILAAVSKSLAEGGAEVEVSYEN